MLFKTTSKKSLLTESENWNIAWPKLKEFIFAAAAAAADKCDHRSK